MGKRRIVAETGAGQHGVATATVCALLGLECHVYMGSDDMARQSLNVFRMRLLGAEVREVTAGSRTLKDAINEAMRDWVTNVTDTYYLLGSVLGPHPYPLMVREFQSVIGARRGRSASRSSASCRTRSWRASAAAATPWASSTRSSRTADVRLIGVEAGGRGITPGGHAARFAGGSAGVLQGTRSYVLQDADGNVELTHSISAGLDYAVGRTGARLAARLGPRRIHVDCDDDGARGVSAAGARGRDPSGARVVARDRARHSHRARLDAEDDPARQSVGPRRQGRDQRPEALWRRRRRRPRRS